MKKLINKGNWSGETVEISYVKNILSLPNIGKFNIIEISSKEMKSLGFTEFSVVGTADSDFNGVELVKVTGMLWRGKTDYTAEKYGCVIYGEEMVVVAAQMLYNII